MKTFDLFLEAIEPREESPAVPENVPVQKKLDLKGAGLRQKEDDDRDHNDLQLATNKTIPDRVRSQIERSRAAGQKKIDPRAFFVQTNPGNRAPFHAIRQAIENEQPELMDVQNEGSIRKGLESMGGNHPTLDLISHRASAKEHERSEATKYAEGIKQGKITNPRLALQSLFVDAQGNPNHKDSGKLKQEIFKKLIHPHIDEEYEYDQFVSGEVEPNPQRSKQLRELLGMVGYEFDEGGAITRGRVEDMTLDEIGERLSSYTWEPDDAHRAMLGLKMMAYNSHNDDTLTLFDDINTSMDEGSRKEDADVEEPYIGVHKKMERSAQELLPQLKKSGLLDVLGPDHPLNNETGDLVSSASGEILQALDENDINSISTRHAILNGIKDIEDASANPKITDASVNMMMDELLSKDLQDDDMNDREYFGYNTRYDISDGGAVEGEMDYDMQRRITDDSAEVSWWPIIDDRYNTANVTDPESFLDGRRGRTQLVRKLHLANRFLNSEAGKGMDFNDIFADEESRGKFEQFVKKFTAMDAKQNWQNNAYEDFSEGQVFKNQPMSGGRGGNVRERMYSRMGFGEVLDDGYQYGYKPGSDEGVPAPKLKPMDRNSGFDMFDEERAQEDFYDEVANVIEDESLVRGYDSDYIRDFVDRIVSYGDIDMRDYTRSEIVDIVNNAREQWADMNAMDELEEVLVDSDVFTGIEDEDEKDDFQEWLQDYASNNISPNEAMDMLNDHENGELDDYIKDLYNKFLQSRGRTQ